MALYRVRRNAVLYVEALGREVGLEQNQVLDSENPEDAPIIDRWPTYLRRDSDVEQATAAPGEKRTTRRKEEAA